MLKPNPQGTANAGFHVMMFLGASGTAMKRPAQEVEQRAPAKVDAQNIKSFSYLTRNQKFKEIPAKFADAYREMNAFKAFLDGWDGQGSKAILGDSVDDALSFLAMLPSDLPPPEASAASDGTVDWYWRNGPKAATVTFYRDRRAAYFALTSAVGVKDAFQLADKIPAPLIKSLRQL